MYLVAIDKEYYEQFDMRFEVVTQEMLMNVTILANHFINKFTSDGISNQ